MSDRGDVPLCTSCGRHRAAVLLGLSICVGCAGIAPETALPEPAPTSDPLTIAEVVEALNIGIKGYDQFPACWKFLLNDDRTLVMWQGAGDRPDTEWEWEKP